MDNLQFAKEVMPLYIDTAKTYAQLASGALAFTITFKEKILGMTEPVQASALLLVAWASYLVAIASSVLYQWAAVHWIELLRNDPKGTVPPHYPLGWLGPHLIYGCMVSAFFMGSLFLVISSARQLEGASLAKGAEVV